MYSDLDDIFRSFDSAFGVLDTILKNPEQIPVSRLPTILVSSAFPPADIYEDQEGDLVFELATAGYKEEEISIKFEDDYLKLSITPSKTEETRKYLQKGIKKCEVKSKYFVPAVKYDASLAEAKLLDGILTIRIPIREAAKPREVKINLSK